jgi:hypothetical protein
MVKGGSKKEFWNSGHSCPSPEVDLSIDEKATARLAFGSLPEMYFLHLATAFWPEKSRIPSLINDKQSNISN